MQSLMSGATPLKKNSSRRLHWSIVGAGRGVVGHFDCQVTGGELRFNDVTIRGKTNSVTVSTGPLHNNVWNDDLIQNIMLKCTI